MRALAAILVLMLAGCGTFGDVFKTKPVFTEIPVPVECPIPQIPVRPAFVTITEADKRDPAMASIVVRLQAMTFEQLVAHALQQENLLQVYADQAKKKNEEAKKRYEDAKTAASK